MNIIVANIIVLLSVAGLVILIHLIVKRIKDKKNEKFEQRDN